MIYLLGNLQPPTPGKIGSALSSQAPLKVKKPSAPPLLQKSKKFSAPPPAERGGGGHYENQL